jgi:hypothetical protein
LWRPPSGFFSFFGFFGFALAEALPEDLLWKRVFH